MNRKDQANIAICQKEILKKLEVEGFTLFLIKSKEVNNLYGISKGTGKIWRVQSVSDIYRNFSQTPYVGLSKLNDQVIVTDFCGCRFVVEPSTGEIIERISSVK